MTAYLASAYTIVNIPELWAREIAKVIAATGAQHIIDLGSGSAGPIPLVAAELQRLGHPVTITLSDYYPRPFPSSPTLNYCPHPVDARAVPGDLHGIRTMFAAFHHFRPADAAAIAAEPTLKSSA